jgi:hypothetical protein
VTEAAFVKVRRQYNDFQIATYRLENLEGLHWSDVSGGVQARANRAYLSGYVWCDGAIDGAVAHSCAHGEGPHRIKVCVVKKDNPKAIYAIVLERMRWEQTLRRCPFAVDLGERPLNEEALMAYLAQNVSPEDYARVHLGWWPAKCHFSPKRAPKGPQIWFADAGKAKAFAMAFSARDLGHVNQGL